MADRSIYDFPLSAKSFPGLALRDGDDGEIIVTIVGDESGNHIVCPRPRSEEDFYSKMRICHRQLRTVVAARGDKPIGPPMTFKRKWGWDPRG